MLYFGGKKIIEITAADRNDHLVFSKNKYKISPVNLSEVIVCYSVLLC